MGRTVRILSIDGGGIRGIIPGQVLAALEQKLGQPVAKCFDMVAGTSTGGILAAGLTYPGFKYSASELVSMYVDRGPQIFDKGWGSSVISWVYGPLYSSKGIDAVLLDKFGDVKLSEAARPLIITSYDLDCPTPYFFKSWKARGQDLDPGQQAVSFDFLMRNACRATSAAPTYFPPAQFASLASGSQTHNYVDGGVFANNPAMCALASARKLYPDLSKVIIVSVGTGSLETPVTGNFGSWGKAAWAAPIIDVMMDGSADIVDYQLRQLLDQPSESSIDPSSLGVYYRFQLDMAKCPNPPNKEMDDVSKGNLTRLVNAGAWLASQSDATLTRLARILVPAPAPVG